MADNTKDYTKGINIKTQTTRYGDIIKVGINLESFKQNPVSQTGWVNFEIKKSKSGSYYAENEKPYNGGYKSSESSPGSNTVQEQNNADDTLMDEEEIPF